MSKKGRSAKEREAAIKAAAKGSAKDRRERQRRRSHGRVGRPDGPLARRRRTRTRLLLAALLLLNLVVVLVWRDWRISLATLIVSVVVAPMLIGLLVRRR